MFSDCDDRARQGLPSGTGVDLSKKIFWGGQNIGREMVAITDGVSRLFGGHVSGLFPQVYA